METVFSKSDEFYETFCILQKLKIENLSRKSIEITKRLFHLEDNLENQRFVNVYEENEITRLH